MPWNVLDWRGLGPFPLRRPDLIYPAAVIMGTGSWMYVPKLLTLPMRMAGMTPERASVVWVAPDFFQFRNVRIAETGRWDA